MYAVPGQASQSAHLRADRLTASLAVAIWPGDGKEPEALLSASDRALYSAKQTGRNKVVRYDEMPAVERHAAAGG